MIGKLTGVVETVGEDHVLLDVGGVGYVVHCAPATLSRLAVGARAALYTDMVVREDLLQLFGFATLAEREWHRVLTGVQGVGARVSLGILGALGAEGTARALASGDQAALRRAPGVGPKLALRIVTELADKAPAQVPPMVAPGGGDALSALLNLGYDRGEAARALATAPEGLDTPGLVRFALRALGRT